MPTKPSRSKKVAMVQPPPAKPKPAKPTDLFSVLQKLGNDRPYFLVATEDDYWIVHFLGDLKPSGIIQIDGKWKIVQAN